MHKHTGSWSDDFSSQPPVFSHDGSRLAYLAESQGADGEDGSTDIRIQNIDGSDDYALTNDSWDNVNPLWSPDDTQIAFRSERDVTFAIYIVNLDGSNPHRVTEPVSSPPLSFTWSPDGELLAFSDASLYVLDQKSGEIVAHESLYILDLNNGETTKLFTADYPNYFGGLSWQP